MQVPDSVLLQRNSQLVLTELRISARLRDRTDVDELLNAVRLENFKELLDREGGVADGEDRQGFNTARR
jgi:hypothetical protein